MHNTSSISRTSEGGWGGGFKEGRKRKRKKRGNCKNGRYVLVFSSCDSTVSTFRVDHLVNSNKYLANGVHEDAVVSAETCIEVSGEGRKVVGRLGEILIHYKLSAF